MKAELPTLKYVDVRRVGKALTKLAEDDPRIIVSIKHDNIKLYRLPSPPPPLSEETHFYNVSQELDVNQF